ncbi:cytochrome P450 [Armillaria gallica]|uniref:Cytochrome P450 n=1 Tax=Armillaria gallica TaxID=47427 RepID=A0A2H3DAH5_ARMGA|nr:cytochrome P450 [Armillaria gallica]
MQSIIHYIVLSTATFSLFYAFLRFKGRKYAIEKIRGPPSPSSLFGLSPWRLLRSRQHLGDLEMDWYQTYGAVYRTKGCFGQDILDVNRINGAATGQGLIFATGEIHQRQRRILGPAFTASQLRLFLNVFQASAVKLTEQINERVDNAKVLNMLEWTSKAALDIIGITSFRYEFNSLSGGQTELMAALNNLLDVAMKVSRPIFEKQLKEVANDVNPAEKDVVNVLALAHLNDDAKKKMDDTEIDSQLATFVLAGHDTTANTMAWLLYELSLHPEDQAKIRGEISQAKSNAPGALTSNDYDSMLWLNACIKETLRLHPLAHCLFREPAQDDILPLSEPVIISDGKSCSQIPIPKGQIVLASIYTYNRFWGDDAEKWNPNRFLDGRDTKQTSLGVYANLLTFSAGIRGCVGWRFAVMELQSVVTELLSNFEFSMPKGVSRLQHSPAGIALIPIVPGKAEEGAQIPLLVTELNKWMDGFGSRNNL